MLKGIGRPGNQDQKTDENGADGVDVPHDSRANNGHHKAERIDSDIVSVVDEEDMHGRVATEDKTIDAESALGEDLALSVIVPRRVRQVLTSN